MNPSDDKLQTYIRKVLEIQNNKKSSSLTKDDFQQLIQELDLTESDRDDILKTFEGYRKRGQGFRRYGLWDSAIEELSQAAVLQPFDVETLFGLADAYFHRWMENEQYEDKNQAEAYARQCLEVNPSCEEALELISQLKKAAVKGRKKSGRRLLISAVFLVIGGISLGAWLLYNSSSSLETVQPPPVEPSLEESDMPPRLNPAPNPLNTHNPDGSESPEPTLNNPVPKNPAPTEKNDVTYLPPVNAPFSTHATESSSSAALSRPGEQTVPVILYKDENASYIKMAVERSTLSRYDQSYAYKLYADFISDNREISQLKMQVQAVSPDGTVIFTDWPDAVSKFQPSVRPGDVIPFGYLQYSEGEAPEISEVRLSVSLMQSRPAPSSYEPSPLLPLTWAGKKPQNVDLKVSERLNSRNNAYVKLILGVENSGQTALTSLKFEIQWISRDGRMILSKPLYAVSTSGPGFKPGQRRAVGGTYKLPEAEIENVEKIVLQVVSAAF